MTGNTKQEALYSALMKLNDKFCADMKWSPDATEMEKTLVKCNLNGFCGFISREMLADVSLLIEDQPTRDRDADNA